jgi:hypothetical protein
MEYVNSLRCGMGYGIPILFEDILTWLGWGILLEQPLSWLGPKKITFGMQAKHGPAQSVNILRLPFVSQKSDVCTVELIIWPMVSRPIRLGIGYLYGAHNQIFLFPFFCRTIVLLFVLGRPLWREDGSVICSVICQWSEPRRTHNHILLSHRFVTMMY